MPNNQRGTRFNHYPSDPLGAIPLGLRRPMGRAAVLDCDFACTIFGSETRQKIRMVLDGDLYPDADYVYQSAAAAIQALYSNMGFRSKLPIARTARQFEIVHIDIHGTASIPRVTVSALISEFGDEMTRWEFNYPCVNHAAEAIIYHME